jgi:hypothetical protein
MITDEEFQEIYEYGRAKIVLKNGKILIGRPSFHYKEDCENEAYDHYNIHCDDMNYPYPIYQKDIVSVEFLKERTWDEDDEEE